MTKGKASLWIGGIGAALAASAAPAQTGNSASPVIGPPALQNFQLQPQQRIVTQPPPAVQVAPPPPATTTVAPQPAPAQRQAPSPAATRPTPTVVERRPPAAAPPQRPPSLQSQLPSVPAVVVPPSASAPRNVAPPAIQPQPQPQPASPATSEPAPISIPGEAPPPADAGPGAPVWIATLAVAALALLGLFWLWRRRRRQPEAWEEPGPAPSARPSAPASPPPPPEPAARPWLEIELRAERATFNTAEALVQFELDLANVGASAARNVRIDVKLFNAGAEQDREIGAFFRTAGRDSARVNLPGIEAGVSGTIRGEVGIAREEMKALRLDERLLYIPVIAVNVLYDYGEGHTGQTSKSYVVGRELQQPSEKMGAFRVDQGPRVWRTIGQRQHKLARRI